MPRPFHSPDFITRIIFGGGYNHTAPDRAVASSRLLPLPSDMEWGHDL
jgi:hypothetical protein